MAIREKNGKWHYRFQVDGHPYSATTGLEATKRNRARAEQAEAEARRLVTEGRAVALRVRAVPFSDAVESFLKWAEGEYRDHPNTAKRLRTSMTSLRLFFSGRTVPSITPGRIEDYKGWRRAGTSEIAPVAEVTVRHDLHALSSFFRYAEKHGWAKYNPVAQVEIPSDAEAVRMHVLTPTEEAVYFAACLHRTGTAQIKEHVQRRRGRRVLIAPHKRTTARDYQDLYDLGRLMIQQGCRPEELRELERDAVDLEAGAFEIRRGKSRAARRTLPMTAESREILARRLQTPGQWVFPSRRNPSRHIGNAQRPHKTILKETGLAFVPYDLRHTFASRAANERGMPLPVLAAILGHGNLRSVGKYVHPTQADIVREMRRLDAPGQLGPVLQPATNRAQ